MNWENRWYGLSLLFIVFFGKSTFAQNQSRISSVSCLVYIDTLPISRSSSFGEEQIANGNYQAFAQQYNSLSGAINEVVFWARVNPTSGMPHNTVKVVVYNVNQGLPNAILGTQNVVIDSASTCQQVIAVFPSPINVTGSIIVSIEPFSPFIDNFFLQRNAPPDGQFLNLIKIKQSNQWFKNLAAGDPSFDFDFLILPLRNILVTSSFTYTQQGSVTQFNNMSINAYAYLWDFGDGVTSTLTNPSHQYQNGNYSVKLLAYTNGIGSCYDSTIQNLTSTNTGINDFSSNIGSDNLIYDYKNKLLIIDSDINSELVICDALSKLVFKRNVIANQKERISLQFLSPGVYFVQSSYSRALKLVIQ